MPSPGNSWALGHQPVVFAPKPRKLSMQDAIYPYEMVRPPRFYSTHYFISVVSLATSRRNHRRQPFDVLHCHGIYPPGLIWCRW